MSSYNNNDSKYILYFSGSPIYGLQGYERHGIGSKFGS